MIRKYLQNEVGLGTCEGDKRQLGRRRSHEEEGNGKKKITRSHLDFAIRNIGANSPANWLRVDYRNGYNNCCQIVLLYAYPLLKGFLSSYQHLGGERMSWGCLRQQLGAPRISTSRQRSFDGCWSN